MPLNLAHLRTGIELSDGRCDVVAQQPRLPQGHEKIAQLLMICVAEFIAIQLARPVVWRVAIPEGIVRYFSGLLEFQQARNTIIP